MTSPGDPAPCLYKSLRTAHMTLQQERASSQHQKKRRGKKTTEKTRQPLAKEQKIVEERRTPDSGRRGLRACRRSRREWRSRNRPLKSEETLGAA